MVAHKSDKKKKRFSYCGGRGLSVFVDQEAELTRKKMCISQHIRIEILVSPVCGPHLTTSDATHFIVKMPFIDALVYLLLKTDVIYYTKVALHKN